MNALNWFEIPAVDMERAAKFYSTVLGVQLEINPDMGEMPMVFLPVDEQGVGGALVTGEGIEPSQKGTLVYLNGGEDLSPMLDRVEGAGGKVTMPKISIGEHGYIGLFIDSEGNRVGLHSMG